MKVLRNAVLLFLFFSSGVVAQQPLFRAVDIDVGGTEQVQFSDGKRATVKLVSISETRDKARSAIREARAEVEINGSRATLSCGNYRLPVALGEVQADCTVTKAYYQNTDHDHWGLGKDARLAPLAGGLALHATGIDGLSCSATLVRFANPNGERTDLR